MRKRVKQGVEKRAQSLSQHRSCDETKGILSADSAPGLQNKPRESRIAEGSPSLPQLESQL